MFRPLRRQRLCLLLSLLMLASCADWTDGATRLAYGLERGAEEIGSAEGDQLDIDLTPSTADECTASYKVQFDEAGAIIVWCYDQAGTGVVSSHSTSYHARFVVTPRTYILDKGAGQTVTIELQRVGGRVLITAAR